MDSEVLNRRIENLMGHPFQPEPQTSELRKSFAGWYLDNKEEDSLLITHCNINGTQLRNDVTYQADCSQQKDQGMTPAVNRAHLEEFKTIEELKCKLKEMPSEWTAVIMTRGFDSMSIIGTTKSQRKNDPTILITRLMCGSSACCDSITVTVPPKGNVSDANIVQRVEELQDSRRSYCKNYLDANLAEIYQSADATLKSYVKEVDSYWLREWKCLLSGRLVDSALEKALHKKIAEIVPMTGKWTNIRNKNEWTEILYLLTVNAHHLKDTEILKALKHTFYGDQNDSGDLSDLEILVDQLKAMNSKFAGILKAAEKYPVILITDNYFEQIPWEMTAVLSGNPVCRLQSLSLLYAMFKYHEPHIINGYREVLVDSAFCLLNPSKDLVACEDRIGKFLQTSLPWVEVSGGQAPAPEELSNKLRDCRLYLYCGHGSGSHYLPSGSGKNLVSTIAFLYGCCSNLPQGQGGRTPYQNSTYAYLVNGCSCLIGCLYDVNSSEADLACIKTLSRLFCRESAAEDEGDVLRAALEGKYACKKYVTSCALVSRGIPVKVKLKLAPNVP